MYSRKFLNQKFKNLNQILRVGGGRRLGCRRFSRWKRGTLGKVTLPLSSIEKCGMRGL